jgi:tight adherence protein B
MRRALATLLVLLAAAAASSAAAAEPTVQLTPVGRLPFPERGYVVDLPAGTVAGPRDVEVRENGRLVQRAEVSPLEAAGIHSGVVLAVDASDSMRGAPLRAAVAAAQAFVAHRQPLQEVGVVAFNGGVRVLEEPTSDATRLEQALAQPPALEQGTRIYDALDQSLTLLQRARLSTSSIVLLSDGADLGSSKSLEDVLRRARSRHVRFFTVGLRSGSFEAGPLRTLAERSGGSYAEAPSAARLEAIYAALAQRLAGEYLVRYRSDAAPHSHVDVEVAVRGVGAATAPYTAPTPAGLEPFHRSFFSRLVLSPGATALLSLLVAALAALALIAFLRPRRSTVVERVTEFAGPRKPAPKEEKRPVVKHGPIPHHPDSRLGKLELELEIARIDTPAMRIVLVTGGATFLAMVLLALISPIFAILALLVPLAVRSWIRHKLKRVRDEFADQLAPNLQVLASALRVGHSFIGALTVVVENAHEPSKSELQRVVTDEQLGVPVEEAVRRVAARMASRDLEQVALLAELQRTAGGNAAEVLDTVVQTLRERADLRGLIRTLTAQGRMARWILTALPVVAGLAMFALQGDLMRPLLTTGGGQIMIVVASLMVVSGSLVIQKIVDINV